MSKAAALSLLICVQMVAFSGGVLAQEITTIPNTTNACINSTYKSYYPNMISPTAILIDRRVNINPVTVCATSGMGSASCGRDPGTPMFLFAFVSGAQITMNPFCSWACGTVCGTIITDGASGLPVELMEFSVDDHSMPTGSEGN